MARKALSPRMEALARHLQKHPEGLQAGDILTQLPDYQKAETSPDTLRQRLLRDLKALADLGLAGYRPGNRRHTIWKPGAVKTVNIIPEEQAVALVTLGLFGELPLDRSMSARIDQLMNDARVSLPKRSTHYAALQERIALKPWVARRKRPMVAPEIFETLLDATLRQKNISFEYRTTKGKDTRKDRISPLALISYRDIYYLAFHEPGGDHPVMAWPLHRFNWVTTVPCSSHVQPDGWHLETFIRNWTPIPGGSTEGLVTVRLRFTRENAVRNLRDAPLLDCNQEIRADPDHPGAFLFSATLKPDRELMTWLLYFGKYVEVLEPASLRRAMQQEVQAMATLYQC